MVTKTIDVKDEETTLQSLLAQVHQGVEIILSEEGKPIARLSPLPPANQWRKPDLHPDAIWTSDDFDEPLSDEFWLGESE